MGPDTRHPLDPAGLACVTNRLPISIISPYSNHLASHQNISGAHGGLPQTISTIPASPIKKHGVINGKNEFTKDPRNNKPIKKMKISNSILPRSRKATPEAKDKHSKSQIKIHRRNIFQIRQ
ncbi:uncharacterized protein G2W53_000955 [Senna tora]|uniref:Uncharacterized protein n=1 Tax=Senna tora TaxID=362788 RepID=A0A835CL24_9FABA|nr:uncharacterized protein G2W53_000955 [Senna tora]